MDPSTPDLSQDPSSGPEYIAVGQITKPHGLRGEVRVKPLTENPQRFAPGSAMFVGADASGLVSISVSYSRPHQAGLRVRFDAVSDAAAAETLRGQFLFIPVRELGELQEGEYWEHELVGLDVHNVDGTRLGALAAVIDRPGQDLWSIDTSAGEVLFPAARELVREVNLEQRVVVIDPPEGLF